jgi:hypothetical protein
MKAEKARVKDNFYDKEVREMLIEDDEIDEREEGFMQGYEGGGNGAF